MAGLLDRINAPADLKLLNPQELPVLAEELRREIIENVSKTGGHLASSLGVVELTLALYYVFDLPRDRVIWDVGHQAYAHKLLTGRRKQFHTLRQYNGISGFLKMDESPYDFFGAGHSSTSISAALGIAESKYLKKEEGYVIAVIGDGSLTAGISFEGLNQAGHLKRNLIVVLNDNGMSIAPNVGAISSFLSRKLTGRFMTSLRYRLKNLLKALPNYGEEIYHILRKAEESFKSFFTPGIMFEGLGFHYVGPINGHSFSELIETFTNIKNWEGPILVHVLTKKGKGYPPAESDPYFWHGVEPFDVATGKPLKEKSKTPSFTSVFGKTIVELARGDRRIVAITAAMPGGTGLDEFAKEFPERFFDVGIAEQHGITFAAGLATQGFRPVCAIYSTFMQRAYDQILHDVCLQNLPVVFALDRAGIVGADGATHQGLFDISYLRSIPNIIIMAPKDEDELRHMLKTAIESGRPCAVRYPKGTGFGVPLSPEIKLIEIGKAEVLKEGHDVSILALGHTVHYAIEAEEILDSMGISAGVINMRFVKPIDTEVIIQEAHRTGRIVTVEENVLMGGFGSAVLECLSDHNIVNVRVARIGVPDEFVEHGPQDVLRAKYGINPQGIARTCMDLLGSTSRQISMGKGSSS